MTVTTQTGPMSEGRGLLTDSERDALAGNASDSYRYKTRSFLRARIGRVAEDIEVLEEHDPDLLEELREVVCEE